MEFKVDDCIKEKVATQNEHSKRLVQCFRKEYCGAKISNGGSDYCKQALNRPPQHEPIIRTDQKKK